MPNKNFKVLVIQIKYSIYKLKSILMTHSYKFKKIVDLILFFSFRIMAFLQSNSDLTLQSNIVNSIFHQQQLRLIVVFLLVSGDKRISVHLFCWTLTVHVLSQIFWFFQSAIPLFCPILLLFKNKQCIYSPLHFGWHLLKKSQDCA